MTGALTPVPDWRQKARPGLSLAAARSTAPVDKGGMPAQLSQSLARILRPQAAYRWLLPQLAAITPQYIEMTLRGALAGSHVQAWELFDLMEDSWPRLVKNANQLKMEVVEELKGWRARPYQEEDKAPTASAKDKAEVVNKALLTQRPDPAADENAFGGMVYDIMDAWFKGVSVQEIDWEARRAGRLGIIYAPRATFWVHPVCYAWSVEGRLGLRQEINLPNQPENSKGTNRPGSGMTWQSTAFQPRPTEVTEFPEHKFILSISKAKSGSALGGARLRSLAWWWCAANFSADWLLNLAQIWQLPFRWANYDPNAPQATVDAICTMLENMGSNAWAAFPAGTTLELKESKATGGHGPADNMVDRADKNCDLVCLGQTLTSDVSKDGGSRSQGEVHERVEDKIRAAACGFVAEVINTQLIRSICLLNYGEEDGDDECPAFRGEEEEESTVDFKREVFKAFMADGTVCDVLANQTDLQQLTKDVGLPVNTEYEEPYLPVTDKSGAKVSGEVKKNAAGKIVGGDTEKTQPEDKNGMPPEKGKGNPPAAQAAAPAGEMLQAKQSAPGMDLVVEVLHADLAGFNARLQAIAKIDDEELRREKLAAVLGDLEAFKKNLSHDPAIAQAIMQVLSAGLGNGLSEETKT